jgi:hypothetical protein
MNSYSRTRQSGTVTALQAQPQLTCATTPRPCHALRGPRLRSAGQAINVVICFMRVIDVRCDCALWSTCWMRLNIYAVLLGRAVLSFLLLL